MVKRGGKKKNNFIKWICFGLLILAVLFLAYKVFTGQVVSGTGKIVWSITDSTGFCLGKILLNSTEITDYLTDCMNYPSKTICEADSKCKWGKDFFVDSPEIEVKEGWNLLNGLYFPGQISGGTLTPNDILSIYGFNPYNKKYLSLFPLSSLPQDNLLRSNYIEPEYRPYLKGSDYSIPQNYLVSKLSDDPSSYLAWVYFDKAGTIKFRLNGQDNHYNDSPFLQQIALVNGWNFVGVYPTMFFDANHVKQTSFTLNDLKGDCNIVSAYYYGAGTPDAPLPSNSWTPITLSDAISNTQSYKTIVIKVSNDCFLAKSDSTGKTCTDTNGIPKSDIANTVTVKDSTGNTFETISSYCDTTSPTLLHKPFCNYNYGHATGTVAIENNFVVQCSTCTNGACAGN